MVDRATELGSKMVARCSTIVLARVELVHSKGKSMTTTTVWHVEQHKDILELIGRVTVRWAALDLLLQDIVYIAITNPAAAAELIFGSANAGKQRLEKFDRAIGASRFTIDQRRRLLEITAEFASLLGTRNDIIHSPLIKTYSVENSKLRANLVQIKRTGKASNFSIDTVNRHIDHVGSLLTQLEAIRDEVAEEYLQPPHIDH